jgi:hypothetical protein
MQPVFSLLSLWRRPPTGHATLCNDPPSVFQGGAPCPNRTIRESMHWSACAWRQIACNWRGTFRTLLCSRISFGWRGYGPTWRFEDRVRIRRPSADTQTKKSNRAALLSPRASLLTDGVQRSGARLLLDAMCELAMNWLPEGVARVDVGSRHARRTCR